MLAEKKNWFKQLDILADTVKATNNVKICQIKKRSEDIKIFFHF